MSITMLDRFISLFLVAALSVGALATFTCPAIHKDCDTFKDDLARLYNNLRSFSYDPTEDNASGCHISLSALDSDLHKASGNAESCQSLPDSEAGVICNELKEIDTKIYSYLELIVLDQASFEAVRYSGTLCKAMTSFEQSFKSYVDVMLKQLTPTNCPHFEDSATDVQDVIAASLIAFCDLD